MIHILFSGVGWTDIALTLNRVAVGMFFLFSGYHKLFNAQRQGMLLNELEALHIPAVGINQWWVPIVACSAGGAVVIGECLLRSRSPIRATCGSTGSPALWSLAKSPIGRSARGRSRPCA